MKISAIGTALLVLVIACFWTSVPSGCANIIPPSGGPRDTIGPKLLSVTPRDSTTNFRGNRITFVFDEYIADLQDIQNNLLFTPTFDRNPEIAVRARTVTLRLRDSLQPNTTYTFAFGNAIRDVNEANVVRNFTYTFSTGPQLDSITFGGKVILAQSAKTDSTLVVLLHRNLDDSAVIKDRPVYVARVDGAGNFRFRNLPQGSFAVYALGEAGLLRRYQSKSQLFAFSDTTVVTGQTREVTLYAYAEQPKTSAPAQATRPAAANNTDRRLQFTSSPSGNSLDLQSDYVITFATPLRNFESSLLSLTSDSAYNRVAYRATLDSSRTLLRIQSTWKDGALYNLILNRDFAEDSAGRKLLKTDTLNFNTKRLSDYGQVNIRVRNLPAGENAVLQFVQGDVVVFGAALRNGVFASRLFNPGDYELRVLYDRNNNGVWDPGRFFGTKRQPEKVVLPTRKSISVKPGLENEVEVTL